jgi:hypothetical protein
MAAKDWTSKVAPFLEWRYEISCFMVLMGEQEEFDLRLMRPSTFECLSAAPVAGLGSYIRSSFVLCQLGKSHDLGPLETRVPGPIYRA